MSDGMQILERIIRQSRMKHEVIASNIANVDTPNYKVKDMNFGQVLGSEMGLATTNPKHLPAAGRSASGEVTVDETRPWADKNNVELDLEVAKMTQNAMLYQAGVSLFTKQVAMFKAALRTSG